MKVLVTGAGGFIGGHLVKYLCDSKGFQVKAVDIKPITEWFQLSKQSVNISCDVSIKEAAYQVVKDVDIVYNLAADMGGIGFIEDNKSSCMLNVLINTHLLMACRDLGVNKYFFSSSACVYNFNKQQDLQSEGLKEEDAYPAMPEDGYGWEKIFSERMCRHFSEDYGMQVYIARFHNVYGPHGSWEGGREKAPAAACRKIIEAISTRASSAIDIWGSGQQSRSFTYIDDCIKGIELITQAGISEPLNLGSSELVTINQLYETIENIAGVKFDKIYNLNAPKGVESRNSNNYKIKSILNWEPTTSLKEGLSQTYRWIENEYKLKYKN